VGKHGGKKPLKRRRYRWEDNIRMVVRGIGWEGGEWTGAGLV
jgi:hypothetical protein